MMKVCLMNKNWNLIPILSSKKLVQIIRLNITNRKGIDNMKYGIYYNDLRVWGKFNSYEQATNFIEKYDLEQQYEVRSYY